MIEKENLCMRYENRGNFLEHGTFSPERGRKAHIRRHAMARGYDYRTLTMASE